MGRMLVRKADRGRSHADCQQEAAAVRRGLGFAADAQIDAGKLFESLHKYRLRCQHGHVELSWGVDNLPAGVEAHTRYDEERKRIVVTLSVETYEALQQPGSARAAFTLAHEIGHAVMHADQLVRLVEFKHDFGLAGLNRGAPNHAVWEDTEFQADSFAGSLLVPAEAVRAKIQASAGRPTSKLSAMVADNRIATELAEEFGVSLRCASVQVELFRRGKLR